MPICFMIQEWIKLVLSEPYELRLWKPQETAPAETIMFESGPIVVVTGYGMECEKLAGG